MSPPVANTIPEIELGSPAAQRRLMAKSILDFVGFGLASQMVLFLAMGADEVDLSRFQAVAGTLIVGQLFGVYLLCHVSKAWLCRVTDGTAGILCLAVGVIPLVAPGQRSGLYLMMAIVLAQSAVLNAGGAGWWPILQDNVPEATAGRFFSRLRTVGNMTGFAATLAAGWYVGKSHDPRTFAPLFLVAGAALTGRFFVLRRVPEVWQPQPSHIRRMLHRFRLALSDRPFMAAFLMTGLFYGSLRYVIPPVYNTYLKVLGYDLSKLVFLGGAEMLGGFSTLWMWAKPVDRHGTRPLLTPCVLALAVLMAAKAFVPRCPAAGPTLPGLTMIYGIAFLDGVGYAAVLRLLMTKIHWRVVNRAWQSESFLLVANYSTALFGFILPGIASFALARLKDTTLQIPGIAQARFGLVILATTVPLLGGLLLRRRLPAYHAERSVRDFILGRPAAMLGAVPAVPPESEPGEGRT